jgi:hypothetical protein
MKRALVTVVTVAGSVFAVFLATGGNVQQQVDFLADAGFTTPNRDATCPVRLDADFAADAGLLLYQRLKFPVVLTPRRDLVCLDGGLFAPLVDGGSGFPLPKDVLLPDVAAIVASYPLLPDAGVQVVAVDVGHKDVQMPPMPQGARAAIDVVDWNDCTLAASTGPVAALWGNVRPFQIVGAASKPWCRAKLDAGLPCVGLDGGDLGDRNVGACSLRLDPATCERIGTGVIYAGDSPEDIQ